MEVKPGLRDDPCVVVLVVPRPVTELRLPHRGGGVVVQKVIVAGSEVAGGRGGMKIRW